MKSGLVELPNTQALIDALNAIVVAKEQRIFLTKAYQRTYKAFSKAYNALATCPNDKEILDEYLQAQQDFVVVRDFYNNQNPNTEE